MATTHHPRLAFDGWASLAREDPQAFEQQRLHVLEQAILEAPERLQQRLRCLQWKLDRIRETAATPLAASIRMQQLLWDNVTGPRGLLASLQGGENPGSSEKPPAISAKILDFRR
jgi:hypothetical protein